MSLSIEQQIGLAAMVRSGEYIVWINPADSLLISFREVTGTPPEMTGVLFDGTTIYLGAVMPEEVFKIERLFK